MPGFERWARRHPSRLLGQLLPPLRLLVITLLCWAVPSQGQIETAKVTGGDLRGVVKEGVASFKGVPFAAPPVGDLRWRAPQPVKSWSGVKEAYNFAPGPIQEPFTALLIGCPTNMSEDCLYLNVWTPAKTPREKLPVMVWIYGGGFANGMTSQPIYDGHKLAQKGVVLVTVAYRLGPLGFLAHPELSRESGKGSGCYGLQDQVAGLRWVKQNIAQFGGDPSRVTIFGESAGAISVSMLTVVPAARGLFQRAIAQSGASMAPLQQADEPGLTVRPLNVAEKNGQRFLARLGVPDIQAARALEAKAIQKKVSGIKSFWPVADGETIPGDEFLLYEAGKFNDTPVLLGSNSDEGAMFVWTRPQPEDFEKQVRTNSGPATEGILKAYAHSNAAEAFKATKDLMRDGLFGWPAWTWAKLQSRKGKHQAFVYYFDHRSGLSLQGASHAAEIGYVFGNPGGWTGKPTPEDLKLSDMISSYWVNFARNGDPNGPGLPAWHAFSEAELATMVFEKEPALRRLPNLDKLKALDAYFTWRRQQAEARATGAN